MPARTASSDIAVIHYDNHRIIRQFSPYISSCIQFAHNRYYVKFGIYRKNNTAPANQQQSILRQKIMNFTFRKKDTIFARISHIYMDMKSKSTGMQSQPDISVIVITYNQENTIARCLDSILGQRFDGLMEIVIGEDCSNDTTAEICRKYAAMHPDIIRLCCNDANKGLLDNYFDTMLRCRGTYLADCAGDDCWCDPLKLQKQYDLMQKHRDVGMVHTAWQYYDTKTGRIRPYEHNADKVSIYAIGKLLQPLLVKSLRPMIHLSTALWRRDTMMKEYDADQLLFRNKAYTCEDFQIIAVLAASTQIAYLPDITLSYSVGHPSVSSEESFGKTFDFYSGSVKLTLRLQKKYDVTDSFMRGYYRQMLDFLAAQIAHGQLYGRTESLRMISRELPCRPSWKYQAIMAIMRLKPIAPIYNAAIQRISKRKVVNSSSDDE